MQNDRADALDKMLRQRFSRSAPIEEALMNAGMGKRPPPDAAECKAMAVALGVPEEARAYAPPPSEPLRITYRNWEGEVRPRSIIPTGAPRYGTSKWHTEPQWLLPAIDAETGKAREFALEDFGAPKSEDVADYIASAIIKEIIPKLVKQTLSGLDAATTPAGSPEPSPSSKPCAQCGIPRAEHKGSNYDLTGCNVFVVDEKPEAVETGEPVAWREFLDFVKNAPVSSGVCCCGDNMEGHADPMSCGHSPVDQWDYSLGQWLEQLAASPVSDGEARRKALETDEPVAWRVRLLPQFSDAEWFLTQHKHEAYSYGDIYEVQPLYASPVSDGEAK